MQINDNPRWLQGYKFNLSHDAISAFCDFVTLRLQPDRIGSYVMEGADAPELAEFIAESASMVNLETEQVCRILTTFQALQDKEEWILREVFGDPGSWSEKDVEVTMTASLMDVVAEVLDEELPWYANDEEGDLAHMGLPDYASEIRDALVRATPFNHEEPYTPYVTGLN